MAEHQGVIGFQFRFYTAIAVRDMTSTKRPYYQRGEARMQWPRMLIASVVEFELRRLTAAQWQPLRFPDRGELLLWRVRGEWHIVSATGTELADAW